MTTSPLLRRARWRLQPTTRSTYPVVQRHRTHRARVANLPRRKMPVGTAPTWEDFQLDMDGSGRSDEPRIPAAQLDRLFPDGAPASWALLVEEAERPHWIVRGLIGLVSLALGLATVVSSAFAGVVASTVSGATEVLSISAHLIGLVGPAGGLGVVGRALAIAAFVATVLRITWRLTGRRSPHLESRS